MWITAPASWPLSKVLDHCFGHEKQHLETEEVKNILFLYKQSKEKQRPFLINDDETVMNCETSDPNDVMRDFQTLIN